MDSWIINGRCLEYDDETHTYIVDGIIVPSVTQLLGIKFGHKYGDVSAETLNKAAERGTAIHKAIEDFCHGKDSDMVEVMDFAFLMKHYGFDVLENELPIILDFDGKTFAGRLDLILKKRDEIGKAVADIKTTSTLDKEYLGHQLNLYRLGVMQSYGFNITSLYGIHLKDGKRKVVNIPIKEEKWLAESLNIHAV